MPRYDVTGVDLDLRPFPWAGSYFNAVSKYTYIFIFIFELLMASQTYSFFTALSAI